MWYSICLQYITEWVTLWMTCFCILFSSLLVNKDILPLLTSVHWMQSYFIFSTLNSEAEIQRMQQPVNNLLTLSVRLQWGWRIIQQAGWKIIGIHHSPVIIHSTDLRKVSSAREEAGLFGLILSAHFKFINYRPAQFLHWKYLWSGEM